MEVWKLIALTLSSVSLCMAIPNIIYCFIELHRLRKLDEEYLADYDVEPCEYKENSLSRIHAKMTRERLADGFTEKGEEDNYETFSKNKRKN